MTSQRRSLLSCLVAALALLSPTHAAQAGNELEGWGWFKGSSSASLERFTSIAANAEYTVGLRADGTISAWGFSPSGQCDTTPPPAGLTYVALGTGTHTIYAILSDGTIANFGANATGQFTPPAPPPGTVFVEVAGGRDHALALASDGTIHAWGLGPQGQTLVPPLPAGLTYSHIAAGQSTSHALRSDGAIVSFGTWIGTLPTIPAGLVPVAIAARASIAAVILSDGTVRFWGSWIGGAQVPALPPGVTYVQVALGDSHGVALRSDGNVVAWGNNSSGQVGGANSLPPGPYVGVSAGSKHSVALHSDGTHQMWGSSSFLQRNIPPAPAGRQYVSGALVLYGAEVSAYGLLDDGTIVNWGTPRPPPALPAGMKYTRLFQAKNSGWQMVRAYALRSDGAAVSFGCPQCSSTRLPPPGTVYVDVQGNDWGMTLHLQSDGNIDVQGSIGPAPALPAGIVYVQTALSRNHGLALRSDGQVVAWGSNAHGQCNVPALIPGTSYVQVGAGEGPNGEGASVALRSDGARMTWGFAAFNACPSTISPAVTAFGSARTHMGELHADGTLEFCGLEGFGETHPPPLPPGRIWTALSIGTYQTFGVHEPGRGTPYCTAKVNSLGCQPAISGVGLMSSSRSHGYVVAASQALNSKPGLLLYAEARAAVPFGGGFLCIASPVRRTNGLNSGGNPLPANDCSGTYSIDMNSFRAGLLGGNPAGFLSTVGTTVNAQFWGRDPGFGPPNNVQLSDGLAFIVGP